MKARLQKLIRERLLLGNREVNVLGPELVLVDCVIESDCANKALIVAGLRMNQGSFSQKRDLANFHFEYAHFDGVEFSGSFTGCDFGDWDSTENSSITRCNFQLARLHECRFLNCDPGTIVFANWPQFTIVSPRLARDFVASRKWPGTIGISLGVYTDKPEECSAVAVDAEKLALKGGITVGELKDLVASIPGVELRG